MFRSRRWRHVCLPMAKASSDSNNHLHHPSMARDNRHCSPRGVGEPYNQYLARYKTWRNHRDEERRAVRRARLPTPESSIDGDSGDSSDSDNDGFSHGGMDTEMSAQLPRVSSPGARKPKALAFSTAASFVPSDPSPSPSPTHSPAPHLKPHTTETTFSATAFQTAAPQGGAPRHKHEPEARQPPCLRRIINGGGIYKTATRQLRSRSRLSQSSHGFFELDTRGRPRAVAH